MRKRRVILLGAAERDLQEIAAWLLDVTSQAVAARYISRIQARLDSLAFGSERGTVRGEADGLRIIGLLPGVSVAFVVDGDTVTVLRILYRGRSFSASPQGDEPD
jgi:plasmid stabilization system protein ParE